MPKILNWRFKGCRMPSALPGLTTSKGKKEYDIALKELESEKNKLKRKPRRDPVRRGFRFDYFLNL